MIPYKTKNESMEQFLSNPYVKNLMAQVTEEERPQVMQMLQRIFAMGESMGMMVSAGMSNPEVAKHFNKTGPGESGS